MHESQLDWWIDYTMGSEEPFDASIESIAVVKDCCRKTKQEIDDDRGNEMYDRIKNN